MNLITETQYFPPISAFKALCNKTHLILEQYEAFQKMSFRNRCVILGANGLISLTVPIVGGREQKMPISDVEIDYGQPWVRSHIRSLESAYSKAPFYHYYKDEIENMLSSREKYLLDINLKLLHFLFKALTINTKICFTSQFNLSYSDAVDARNTVLPKNFQQNKDNWQPKYSQVFENKWGFQPNLSILDLLFCEGPNAANLL